MVLLSYDRSLKLCTQVPPGETRRHAANQSRVRSIMAAAAAGKGTSLCLLPEPDALDILKAYDISTLPNETAGTDARLMLGCRLTHDFGPVIFMGPGGRLAGMFRDWAIGLPPLNRTLAAQMIESAPTLTRYLEAHGCDAKAGLRACEDTIIKVSGLATDFPDIAALDINPLILAQGHAFAVSAGISLRPSKTVAPLHLVFSPYPGRYEQSLTTRSGLALLIRPIKPEDAHLLRDLWAVFSPQTIYYRFSRYLRELSPEMLAGLTQIDYDREIALAALNPSDAGEKMLAVARLYGEPGDKAAEFSVVVGDPWQGKGIGALLLERLVSIARDRKIKSVWGLIQRENTTMIELARSLDFTITGDPGDPEVEAFLRVG